ncbi:chromosomal replication initiator protein DnaA [Candidatus Peregrinibacteria bacterium]|nr:chromosomal replication initiator protein DnaA [Candidatus Peregrinibacteria bacterium]
MTNKELWVSVLRRLQPTIKKAHFITWFQNTNVVAVENGLMTVGIPTEFALNWIVQHYAVKVLQAAQELNGEILKTDFKVELTYGQVGGNGVNVQNLFAPETEKKVRKVRNVNEVAVVKGLSSGKIVSQMMNNKYSLDNFVIGRDNRLPHAACCAVANMPGGIYNPLYIYGGVGLGKTHLIQAIGNEVLRNFPDKIVKYVTAEKFVTEVVEAIGKRNTKAFKDQYRKVDVFLMDDVQFFARKDSSQQEFFHTFNDLYDGNKQIVITSDRAPAELQGMDERITSRFGMGMVVELLSPDFETRLAILHQKCREYQVIIDPEVLSFVATNAQTSVRELEGILRQIMAECQLCDQVATIRSAAEIMKRMNKAQKIIGYDIENREGRVVAKNALDVLNIVAEYYKVTSEAIVGKDRHKNLMLPRHVCMYLIKNELGESYESIGDGFGGRNHTTVMHACSKTAKKLRTDLRLVRDLNAIKREMGL